MEKAVIQIVKDEPCPYCGARWGHPDPELNYPNRPKIGDGGGWWWRCYNPRCPVRYYNPKAKLAILVLNRTVSYKEVERLREFPFWFIVYLKTGKLPSLF